MGNAALDRNITTTVDLDLNSLAIRVNEICRTATFNLAYSVGALVVTELFGGSSSAWLAERKANASFRAFASRGDLLMSASALCRAVGVYDLTERMGGPERWCHISASHIQEVLPLAPILQERFLMQADQRQWTVRELRNAIRCARPGRNGRRMRIVIESRLHDLHEKIREWTDQVREYGPMEVKPQEALAAREVIMRVRAQLDRLSAAFEEPLRNSRTNLQSDISELKNCHLARDPR